MRLPRPSRWVSSIVLLIGMGEARSWAEGPAPPVVLLAPTGSVAPPTLRSSEAEREAKVRAKRASIDELQQKIVVLERGITELKEGAKQAQLRSDKFGEHLPVLTAKLGSEAPRSRPKPNEKSELGEQIGLRLSVVGLTLPAQKTVELAGVISRGGIFGAATAAFIAAYIADRFALANTKTAGVPVSWTDDSAAMLQALGGVYPPPMPRPDFFPVLEPNKVLETAAMLAGPASGTYLQANIAAALAARLALAKADIDAKVLEVSKLRERIHALEQEH